MSLLDIIYTSKWMTKGDFDGHKIDTGGEMALQEGKNWDPSILGTKVLLLHNFV